ncbi:MAG: hypothetical protein AB7S78_01505 [Candidatus Omnitrophota bacterium]
MNKTRDSGRMIPMVNRSILTFLLHILISGFCINFAYALYGCGEGSLNDENGNALRIISISPDPSSPLIMGQTVQFEVELEYKVQNPNAVISLNIQKGELTENFSNVLIASKTVVLTNHSGVTKIQQEFRVPKTGAVMVIIPLLMAGNNKTSVNDMRAYKVVDENGNDIDTNSIQEPRQISIQNYSNTNGSLRILSYSPESQKILYVGDTIKMTFQINYEVEIVPAKLMLTVQKGEQNSNLSDMIVSFKSMVIHENKGALTLESSFVVPDTTSLMAIVSLMTNSTKPEPIDVQMMHYGIEKK